MRNRNAAKLAARRILRLGIRDNGFEGGTAVFRMIYNRRGWSMPKRGPRPGKHALRDLHLAMAVWKLEKQTGLQATSRAGVCGCDIVAEVAGELGYPVSVQAVRKAWEKYAHLRA